MKTVYIVSYHFFLDDVMLAQGFQEFYDKDEAEEFLKDLIHQGDGIRFIPCAIITSRKLGKRGSK